MYLPKLTYPGLLAQFDTAMVAMLQRPYIQRIASLYTEVPSDKSEEKYAWLQDIPLVKEWIGDKTASTLKDYDYVIRNKNWEASFQIDKNDLDDAQISAIQPRVSLLAQRVSEWPKDLIASLIKNGDTNLAFDGSAFFANRTAPNDNLLGGTGVTLAAVLVDLTTTRAAFMRFTSENGIPLGIMPNLIVCPPELEGVFKQALTAATIYISGATANANPIPGWYDDVIPLPELTDTTDWYAFCTNFPIKPFLFQTRQPVTPVIDDSEVKRNRKIIFSAEMRGNAGYGFYQMAAKVVNT